MRAYASWNRLMRANELYAFIMKAESSMKGESMKVFHGIYLFILYRFSMRWYLQ